MKKLNIFSLLGCICILLAFGSCKESIDSGSRYVFKEETILSYLEKHQVYSDYVRLLKIVNVSEMSDSKVAQLLSARGNYTCFAPTNDAIQTYLESLVESDVIPSPSWDAFTDSTKLDSIRKIIVYNSVIDGGDEAYYELASFPTEDNSEFALSNMNSRKLTVHYVDSDPDSIYINGDCPINAVNRDIPAINGVVFQMEKVVAPSIVSLAGLLQEIIEFQRGPYLVTAKMIKACGYLDTLAAVRDEVYERLYTTGKLDYRVNITAAGLKSATDNYGYLPEHRKYGFTIFSETDDFWEEQLGKKASEVQPEDVQEWVVSQNFYPDAKNNNDYLSEENVLNQWISYHILPYRLSAGRLVIHYGENGYSYNKPENLTLPVMEHYTTMGKRRLIRIYESPESEGVYLNRFPYYSRGRRDNGHERTCELSRIGSRVNKEADDLLKYSMENGLIYAIDAPIAYNDSTRNNIGRERLRIEGMSLFPEAMNNDIRRMSLTAARFQNVLFPDDSKYRYLENLSINEGTVFVYYNAFGLNWGNYQGDEIKGVGRYELTFKLPPIARRGVYEVRYRVLSNSNRGVAQLYFGEDPDNLPVTGIPLDLTLGGKDEISGWEEDTDDQDYNAEVDKRMRNNGFMKGEYGIWNGSNICRSTAYKHVVRRIVTRQTLDPDKIYYLKIKSVLDSDRMEFYMDHLEICPKEVYDNPESPEDIW